jgi:Wzt C-terminal domain
MTHTQVFSGRMIFDHMPKTAGEAVRVWITKSLGRGCVTPHLIGQHRDLIRRYGGNYCIISAHVHFDGHGLDPRYRYITCLREPVDRVVSWLYFVLKNHEAQQLAELWEQAERFVASEGEELHPNLAGHVSNLYVRHFANVFDISPRTEEKRLADALSAIDRYDVWGVYEEMPGFLEAVAALIDLPAPRQIERLNVTRSRPRVAQISPLFRKRLETVNALDLSFYHALRERWQRERVRKPTIAFPESSPWAPYEPPYEPMERVFAASDFLLLSVTPEDNGTFSRGQIVCFGLEFCLARDIPDLEIGIHILDEDGRQMFGTNTTLLGRPLLQIGRGTHRMRYCLVTDLPEGQYRAGFAFAERGAESNLARYDKLLTFQVVVPRLTPSAGCVSLPVEFDYQQTSETVVRLIENSAGTLVNETPLGDVMVEESFDVLVRVENASPQTWVSTWVNPIRLSYHWVNDAGHPVVFDGIRTPLPVREVLPGRTLTARMSVVAPSTPGRYRLQLMPVQEKHCWFDQRGFAPGVLELDVVAPGAARRYPGADARLSTQVGKREGTAIVSVGQEGFLIFGPYAQLPAGCYMARIEGRCEPCGTGVWIDICLDKGRRVLARQEASVGAKPGWIAELPFELSAPVSDLEVRLWVTAEANVRVESLCIEPADAHVSEPVPVEPDKFAEAPGPSKPSSLRHRVLGVLGL